MKRRKKEKQKKTVSKKTKPTKLAMKLSLRKKLLGSFLLVSILFGIASAVSYYNIKQMDRSFTYLIETVTELQLISQNIDSSISNQVSDLRGFLLYGDPTFVEDIHAQNDEVNTLIVEAIDLATREDVVEHFNALQALNRTFLSESTRSVSLAQASMDHAIETSQRNVIPVSSEMRERSIELNELLSGILEQTYTEADQLAQQAAVVAVVVSLLAFLIAIGCGIFISNLISKPISKIGEAAKQVAAGNLTIPKVNVKSNDEIATLNDSFNQMTDNLRVMISQIQANSEQVASSSEQLNASANESAKATDQITESIQSVASGAETQVERTSSANESADEISKGVEEIAMHIFSVTEATDLAKQKSINGLQIVEKTVSQMNAINEQTTQTSTVISSLEDKSNEIGSIVSLITAVSDQTNLLALNAAIEAARAGEHGKGFAVVADEVRKLAEQSNQSAGQISVLIQDIQNDISLSVSSMAEGSETVKQGLTYATEAGSEFKEISTSINDIYTQIDEVSIAVQKIAMGTATMLESIKEASAIAENASSYSQEVAASAEEQTATMEEISASAEMLSRMAEELQETVRKFTV
ncbi:hypothetical protein JCM9140_2598 [Halalkalibacter wakoensis JCM 9140]|uniref:Methyl-accepting chemotaxis protein n=1 Tax=Halalkalibacter wakoensis JCM 9140 TaxID=1236970 RepID=W4Q3K0_9BACI|nr:methyl-accepting chemotaxis protein [Halalkalibacter wakoensis]GAE26520.1 hypothetical protein JCM9140_2598 [Halalkalibacter wakoensis JCM 9140]